MVQAVSSIANAPIHSQKKSKSQKFTSGALGGGVATLGIMGLDYVAPKATRRIVFLDFSNFKGKKIEPFFKKLKMKHNALFVIGSAVLCGVVNCFSKDKK